MARSTDLIPFAEKNFESEKDTTSGDEASGTGVDEAGNEASGRRSAPAFAFALAFDFALDFALADAADAFEDDELELEDALEGSSLCSEDGS